MNLKNELFNSISTKILSELYVARAQFEFCAALKNDLYGSEYTSLMLNIIIREIVG